MPEAYRLGYCDFYGRKFKVNPAVLIPRPETEMMIDAVLNLAGKSYLPGVRASEARLSEDLTILDVGTGSGCVAVTLKLELPKARVEACDISAEALKVARQNARRLGADVSFLQSNLLESVSGDSKKNYDVIVANLPYVDKNWEWLDREALAYEPDLALFADDGGLALIIELAKQASGRARFLILEADPCQHQRIKKVASRSGWRLLETRGFILNFECIP